MMKRQKIFNSLSLQLRKWQHQQLERREQKSATKLQQRQDKVRATEIRGKQRERSCIVFVVAVVSLSGVMGDRFYSQPQLNVNTIAPETIQAPFSAAVEDSKATVVNRQAARKVPVPVLKIDAAIDRQILQKLQTFLAQGDELRQIAGGFPFAETGILSTSTQAYLRSCSDAQWQQVLVLVNEKKSPHPGDNAATYTLEFLNNEAYAAAVKELEAYRQKAPKKFSNLIATISQARQRYAIALNRLSLLQTTKPPTIYESSLLNLSNSNWQKTQEGIRTSADRILAQGISPGLQPNTLLWAVNLQVRSQVPPATEPLATEILLTVLQPNLKIDEAQTQRLEEQAAAAVQPILVSAKKGEVIVKQGERISQTDFILLDYFGLSRRQINWWGLVSFGGVVTVAVGVFGLVGRRFYPKLRQRDRILVLLLTLSTPLLIQLNVPYINLPAIGLLLGNFYGSGLGATVVAMLSLLLPLGMDVGWKHLLTSAVGGMLGSWMAGRMRSREELSLLGVGVGLTQATVYLLGGMILTTTSGLSWYFVLQEAAFFGLSGLVWSIVALGLSPYLENLFDLVTSVRLAELANPNRPLLKRLATEAPGTFQHTLFVSTLAEAAAKELNCNVELVRTGTLYHDIGKLHDPLGFIENQMGGVNKHDEINNPWQSADIIKKHVTEGIVMARKYRLPTAIRAFIPEHQGTMPIAYFYHQARQLAQQDPKISVQEADFHYQGPTPQSRETALVMLADSCEAALRSLQAAGKATAKEPTHEEALAMVNKILRSRWQENQLVDSGLTRSEMDRIAKVFVKIWQQFHHKRIVYPKKS
ncbi:MAG TPA: HDIG domain-containing metalloprotein [Leptolyngbyaceae cyanobacterium]